MLDYKIFMKFGATPHHHNKFTPPDATVPCCTISEIHLPTLYQEHLFRWCWESLAFNVSISSVINFHNLSHSNAG